MSIWITIFIFLFINNTNAVIPPLLNGVFYELYTDVSTWNLSQWKQEFASMKAINIEYVAIRTVYDAWFPNYTSPPPSIIRKQQDEIALYLNTYNNTKQFYSNLTSAENCPYGIFTAFYPSNISSCTIPSPNTNTTLYILQAAEQYNIKIHLGLAFPLQGWGDENWWIGYQNLCQIVFNELYDLYGTIFKDTFIGIYSVFEIGNWHNIVNSFDLFIFDFIKPLSDYIKFKSNNKMVIWGSPYYKNPNTTHGVLSPTEYAQLWANTFINAPNFDFIAPQDGVGASNNSINNYIYVEQYLNALINVSIINNRIIWSNAESFKFTIWGEGTNCKTIESGPIDRFIQQLNVESNMNIQSLISWEYHAYISPFSGPCNWSDLAHQFYVNYTNYYNNITALYL
eukprot:522891_1